MEWLNIKDAPKGMAVIGYSPTVGIHQIIYSIKTNRTVDGGMGSYDGWEIDGATTCEDNVEFTHYMELFEKPSY